MEAVPVDVHVWRLAQRDYNLEKSSTNLTSSAYMRVGNNNIIIIVLVCA